MQMPSPCREKLQTCHVVELAGEGKEEKRPSGRGIELSIVFGRVVFVVIVVRTAAGLFAL